MQSVCWVTNHPPLLQAKSPQQIMGCLVKDYFTRRQNLSPDKIFHVVVARVMTRNWRPFEKDVPTALHSSQGLTVC
ncbi:Nuclear prelamin A recognition factor [Myotis davidii]|uniref:Nuclear prelamin A recognition factor n=1 Tax=Myotis davidii TaxID=225400 RepID=L5LS05_MYODS|nr:Nuclear prelamin A recognition factor [Myotis davidii]